MTSSIAGQSHTTKKLSRRELYPPAPELIVYETAWNLALKLQNKQGSVTNAVRAGGPPWLRAAEIKAATGDQADIPHPSTQPAAQQQEGVQLHLVAAALEKLGEAQSSNSQDRDSSPQGDSTEHARESGLPEAPIEPAAEVQESGSGPPAA
eukprot:CAMPEP_0202891178 /NCGR_PEP_ID=MMETSP1392-20130828/1310_1 /ASSEMBLY_ACC=CAM_ASM_000868 /TAXON_ID=225041 /ORGANISM="Chlamydomonas chlamydogama, Strain SAG 11-48b" /LENGTH=150 /DNA_ID=CAMNT_0049574863 /DNA_START=227 /DNA_END=681 /DNA_ORIENTATION=+